MNRGSVTLVGLVILAVLIAARSPAGARAAPAQPACSWAGTWDTAFLDDTGGEEATTVLQATQDGEVVTGAYDFRRGVLAGVVEGATLSGSWMQGPSYRAPEDLGEFEFTMAADCGSFNGRWRYAGDDVWSVWIGQRRP
jgi:hypothetical protein